MSVGIKPLGTRVLIKKLEAEDFRWNHFDKRS